MKNIKSNFEYHKMVWGEAKKVTETYYRASFPDWAGDMIGAIFTALILGSYFYFKNGMAFDLPGTLISVIIGFCGVVAFRFFYNLCWEIPAKLYRERENEANKFTWKDILVEIPETEKDNPLPACLLISNNKSWNIENVWIKVTNVKKGKINLEIDEPVYFGWADGNDEIWGSRTLYKNEIDGKVIPVANWLHENKGVYLLATNKEKVINNNANFIELEKSVIYTIQVEWCGEIEGNKLDSYVEWYSLSFDENEIHLKRVR